MADETQPVLAEIWRGPILECVHRGTAVVVGPGGEVVEAWGDPGRVVLPRSSCKMLQALPLVESGAADDAGLGPEQLALAAASHTGAAAHVRRVGNWLSALGLGERDLRCGVQVPGDAGERHRLRDNGEPPSQLHNNCSGKHSGFLTVNRHLGGGSEYHEVDHPVQRAVRDAIEEACGESVHGHGIDGCSVPNFALSLAGLARAMAHFARPEEGFTGRRAEAARRIRDAMAAHPVLVAGEGRADTAIMRETGGRAVCKTGAEGVYMAILPERGLGIALKIDDGASRGSEAAIAALLARHGALDRASPVFRDLADAPLLNRRGIDCGRVRAAEALLA